MEVKKAYYKNEINIYRDIEINLIQDFFATNPPDFFENEHRLDFWLLFYITSSQINFSIDYKDFICKKGDLVVISKDKVFSLDINFSVNGYVLFANEDFFLKNSDTQDLDLLKFFETKVTDPVISIDIDKHKSSRQLIDILYKESLNPNSSNKLLKSLFASFAYAVRLENKQVIVQSSISTYKTYYLYKDLIYKHYKKYKMVSDYERLMNISKKTLNKACRETVDLSAKELIINRIILEAKRLLIQGKLKNYEISDYLGYIEPANFSSFFRKNVGLSMNKYRENIKYKNNKKIAIDQF